MNTLHAHNPLGDDHALVHCLVCEPWRSDDVADGVNSRNACLAPLVDDDMRLLDLDAGLLETNVLRVADDADSEDDPIDGQRFGLAVVSLQTRGDVVAALLQSL